MASGGSGRGVDAVDIDLLVLLIPYVVVGFSVHMECPWLVLLQFLHLCWQPCGHGVEHFPVWNAKQVCLALVEFEDATALVGGLGLP